MSQVRVVSRFQGLLRQRRVLLVAALLAFGSVTGACALAVCVDQYNGSGCLMASGCDYYDDATGAFRGSVHVIYHCPISY